MEVCKVHDQTYTYFVSLEMKVRQHLAFLFHAESTLKQTVIDDIMQDEDVLFNWGITANIDDESLSHELLSHIIVNLWLTIRGFSAAGAWMENFKHDNNHQYTTITAQLLHSRPLPTQQFYIIYTPG